jgi:hypothetical protein
MVWADLNSRLERLATNSIARALAFSVIFHLLLFSFVELGYRLGWWKQSLLPATFLAMNSPRNPRLTTDPKDSASTQTRDVPIVFVEVDPAQATPEAPKDAKYYSSANSRAANRETLIDSANPKITGTQDKVPKTTESSRAKSMPLQPAPPAETKAEPEPQPLQPQVQSGPKPGDLAMAKPPDTLSPKLNSETSRNPPAEDPKAGQTRIRPRTLAQAMQQTPGLAGEKMKQEGGVRRFTLAEGLDVKATPFGSYDAAIIAAIQQRWYDLLDDRDFARGYTGKVVLVFRLYSDGSVKEMRVMENEVSDILALICQRAVQDPAPFAPWPNDMRRQIGADYREVRFSFHHN